jgi:hypothetical protein
MSNDNSGGYWSGLIEFHQQEAETARAEVARLRAVIAEADNEAYLIEQREYDLEGLTDALRKVLGKTLRILAKATQTDKEAGA